jgi:hypothetical protein
MPVVKVYKNKKVIAALVALVIALLAALLPQTELGAGTGEAITNVICSVVECQ